MRAQGRGPVTPIIAANPGWRHTHGLGLEVFEITGSESLTSGSVIEELMVASTKVFYRDTGLGARRLEESVQITADGCRLPHEMPREPVVFDQGHRAEGAGVPRAPEGPARRGSCGRTLDTVSARRGRAAAKSGRGVARLDSGPPVANTSA